MAEPSILAARSDAVLRELFGSKALAAVSKSAYASRLEVRT